MVVKDGMVIVKGMRETRWSACSGETVVAVVSENAEVGDVKIGLGQVSEPSDREGLGQGRKP